MLSDRYTAPSNLDNFSIDIIVYDWWSLIWCLNHVPVWYTINAIDGNSIAYLIDLINIHLLDVWQYQLHDITVVSVIKTFQLLFILLVIRTLNADVLPLISFTQPRLPCTKHFHHFPIWFIWSALSKIA